MVHLEYFEGEDGQFYVALVAANNKIMLASEGYASPSNARRAANRVSDMLGGIEVRQRGA